MRTVSGGGRTSLFLNDDQHWLDGSATGTRGFGRANALALPTQTGIERAAERLRRLDLVVDLGADIGSAAWLRGAATCLGLCALTIALAPRLDRPIHVVGTAPASTTDRDELASQSIAPLAFGATSGRRIGATNAVRPLADTPERPTLDLSATLPGGDAIARTLRRSGVGAGEADRAAALIAEQVSLADIRPGTRIDLTLGRRPTRDVPRPLEHLAFRARFDLALEVVRDGGTFTVRPMPIAIDATPLRIRGRVGSSLYRSARAAGAPAKAVEAFIRQIATRMPMSRIGADSQYELIVEQERAATGETRQGKLLYAAVGEGDRRTQLVRWEDGGRTDWFDPKGVGEKKGMMAMPVAARISSSFGWRTHPVLGFRRLHKGMDFAAPYGSPIRAATDGVVAFAGRHGGYGNFVKLVHGGGLATGYGHMSRIAVRGGERVNRGEVIGYVGSTGLSTGPHLHYELWRNGSPINPASVSFTTTSQLSGRDLANFRALVSRLMAVPVRGGSAQ
ncbi:M23 family metallopeptidase [Sphingomonas sp. Y38-1Y]|uniref:M23 family metallopeptidase n=1 Tax=Sphingomonas sp. Y38-1Y TaxID=3078265 RepID=UPI0028F09BE4|nr:peptidoglycan DD-metalloendopeptidase family protein [Sphingomonas sp. Y38-1Y]